MMDHYYTKTPRSRFATEEIDVHLRGQSFRILTASGTFSRKKVDTGTALLVDNAEIEDGWDILDLGCGYGVVGITLARAFPRSKVLMTDINERAVGLARKNSKGMGNVEVISGDAFEKVDRSFDAILLNPPQNAGKELCFRMIEEAKDHLKKEAACSWSPGIRKAENLLRRR